MLDTGCVWDGYFCDFDRNFAIGSASQTVRDAHYRLDDAVEAALDVVRPGIAARDLFLAMDAVLRPTELTRSRAMMSGDTGTGWASS